MVMESDVAVFIGSLRKESLSRRLGHELSALAPADLRLDIVEIGELPFYNQDIEDQGGCDPWTNLRDRVVRAHALLFITPEYNRSVPAALKNALDVGSRPYGKNAWSGKPAAVVSLSPGAFGGFGANHHLRQTLASVGVSVMPQPEIYIGGADKLFGEDGRLDNESTATFLSSVMLGFSNWIRLFRN